MHTTIRERTKGLRERRTAHVLVVIDEPCRSSELCAAIRRRAARARIEALVIAPAHGSAHMQWYVDEDAARAEAARRLRECVACLAADGIRAEGRLADPDPVQAVADALDGYRADEILLVTAPQRPSTWLRPSVIDRVRESFSQPVEHLVVPRPVESDAAP